MQAETFGREIAVLEAHFQQNVPKATKVLWWSSLADLSDEEFAEACFAARREPGRRFVPLPNELRAMVLASRDMPARTGPRQLGAGDYDAAADFARRDERARNEGIPETPYHEHWRKRLDAAMERWNSP